MQTKTYLVTNNSEGSICITGRQRIDIPGLCKDLPLSLPENTARQTISRLKQRYPLLKIREAQENLAGNSSKGDLYTGANSDTTGATDDKGNNGSESDKNQNPTNAGTAPDKGHASSATASPTVDDKNGSQDASSQNQTSTQKPDTRKGK